MMGLWEEGMGGGSLSTSSYGTHKVLSKRDLGVHL
jgi:hypothetical protein